jgi:hypothetical protein
LFTITIERMEVRDDQDIERIAQDLAWRAEQSALAAGRMSLKGAMA